MKLYKTLVAVAIFASAGVTIWAASNSLSITADTLSYNGKTKIATVSGHVVIQRDNQQIEATSGWYNTISKEAALNGGVRIEAPNLVGTADAVHLIGTNQINANGNVYIKKGADIIRGEAVQYNTSTGYGQVSGRGSVTMEGATLQANQIQAWMYGIKAIGIGQVILQSPSNHLYATGNRIDYKQTPGKNDGIAYLSGHAYAQQNGNTLRGNALTIYLNSHSIETQGRSTLVIQN